MGKILLDYAFPITVITPTPAASTAFLKQVCVVAKPKTGQEGNVGTIYECVDKDAVAVRTDNDNADQLFDAGMNKVFVLLSLDLDIEAALEARAGEFFTVLISDDFDDDDLDEVVIEAVAASRKIQDILYTAKTAGTGGNSITITYANTNTGGAASASAAVNAITVSIEGGVTDADTIAAAIVSDSACNALVTAVVDAGDGTDPQTHSGVSALALQNGAAASVGSGSLDVGTFDGVVGFSTQNQSVANAVAVQENRVAFLTSAENKAINMFYAFGSLLGNVSNWRNQQYITMPEDDGIDTLGAANSLFDNKVSFVLSDDEFGERLALFAVGAKAIVAPYILKNLRVDMQSKAVQWISANQPQYTIKNASLLEARLQEDVINSYISRNLITSGTVEITLVQDNFVANGDIVVPEPKALWRVVNEMTQPV